MSATEIGSRQQASRLRIGAEIVEIEPRSVIPGRERWHVSSLRGRPGLGSAVEGRLRQQPGVESVRINSRLGSILIVYAPESLDRAIVELMERALESATARPDPRPGDEPARPPAGADRAASRSRWGAGAAVAVGLAAGAASAPMTVWPALLAGGATVAVLRHFGRQSRRSRAAGLAPDRDRRHPARRLLGVNATLRRRVALAGACSVGGKVLDIAPPLFMGWSIAILTTGPIPLLTAIGIAGAAGQVLFVAVAGGLLWTSEAALEYAAGLSWRGIAQDVQHDLHVHGYRHVQELDFEVLDEEHVGRLATILTEDVTQVRLFLNTGTHDLIQLATNLAVIGPLFYLVAPSIAWVAILPVPVLAWISFRYIDDTSAGYADTRRKASAVSSQLVTNLGGIVAIKSFTTEQYEVERIRRLSLSHKESSGATDRKAAALTPSIRVTAVAGWMGVMVAGGTEVLRGRLLPGTYATMINLTQRFLWPIILLGKTVDDYQRAMAATERVLDLIDTPVSPPRSWQTLDLARVEGDVVFDHVAFAYRGRPPALRDLSLRMEPGKTIGIVGSTGAGKTTIIKLLLRFYEVDAGRILLDGVDIRHFDPSDVRRAISLVSQDVFLFEGSIRENIAYGSFDATDAEVVAAARTAEIHDFVESLPDGYGTVVGERGVKLSGGQRQRISVARAILKGSPILILDEATSAVDNETEAAIQHALRRVAVGRTTIIVAHRLSTIRHADRIYVLGDGGVVEQGTHQQLIHRRGVYASMWAVQSGLSARGDRPPEGRLDE